MTVALVAQRGLRAALLSLAGLGSAWAAPVPLASPPPTLPGFQVDWVQVSNVPHSIANALAALDQTGGFPAVASATQFLSTISLTDASVPFAGPDPTFAIRVSGFITLPAGRFSFTTFHDDGIRLTVGGEEVVRYDSDTSPRDDDSAFFDLPAGVYPYEAISWEQGGQFALSLGLADGNLVGLLVGEHAATAVPAPAPAALMALPLLALIWRRRPSAG